MLESLAEQRSDLIRHAHTSNPYSDFISTPPPLSLSSSLSSSCNHRHPHHRYIHTTCTSPTLIKMSDEESIDDPLLREEQQRLDRLRRRNKTQEQIFTAGLCFLATAFAVLVLCSGRNGIATFIGAGRTTITSTGIGMYKVATTFIGTVRTAITSTGTGAYTAAATIGSKIGSGASSVSNGTYNAAATIGSKIGSGASSVSNGTYNAAATIGSKIGSGASSVSNGTYNAAATFGWEIFQIWNDAMLAVGSAVLHVGGGIATFASSSKEAAKVAMFGSPVLLDCFQDSPGATDDLDGASPNHWSLKTAPAIKAHWNVKSTCDTSSVPKSCPNHARCAGGLVVDCQATDKTGLFVVSKETHADCVLSPKGRAIVASIESQLIDFAVEGKCEGMTSDIGSNKYKSTVTRSKGAAHSTSMDQFAAAVHLSVDTLHLLGPHLDPDIVEYVPGSSSIGIAPNFATNHLDNQLPSSCRQEIERFAKAVQSKVIELSVLHRCKGIKEGHAIDHVVEVDGSIAFSIDGLVEAFAKDPGTADISFHTFELVMPYLNKDVVDAKPVPVSGTSELYVGLTAKFVEEELGQYLPLPCWFPKVVFGFAVSAVGLCWAAVTLCAKCTWEYPKFIFSIFEVWLTVKKVCKYIEMIVTMPIAVYIIDGWVKERLNPLPVSESLCKAILRDEIGAEYFRFKGHRYLIGTRVWFYDRAWGAFEEEFDDSRFNTEYLETEGFEVPMAHWVRV